MTQPIENPNSQARELFYQALELEESQRESFLQQACQSQPELRSQVDILLQALAKSGDFLEAPLWAPPDSDSLIGKKIGPYTLEGLIGAGGMGVVYVARQEHPDRNVALKILQTPPPGSSLIRRFEWEAEFLGRLQHPVIAQIYDAGIEQLDQGRIAFLAMELVDGEPLTRFAEQNHLGMKQRVELFAKICDGVHHAHQKGVLHRDLKPSNILVNQNGLPKILDFGIARPLNAGDGTLKTQQGELLGTVPYMSPEQIRGEVRELDVRSDVYSLGVVLYELLSKSLPHDVSKTPIPQAIRIISEEDAPPLQKRLRSIPRDLSAIVGMALNKEKVRRYDSAAAMADDLRRLLRNETVAACPPSAWYQLQKFVRRRTGLVVGIAAAVLALVIGTIVSTIAWQREQQSATTAMREASANRELNEVLSELLLAPDPIRWSAELHPEETRAIDVFERVTPVLEDTTLDPGLRIKLHRWATQTNRNLGYTDEAMAIAANGYELALEYYGGLQHEDSIEMLSELALSHYDRGLLDQGLPLQRQCTAAAIEWFGPDAPESLDQRNNLALFLLDLNQLEEAESILREVLSVRRQRPTEPLQLAQTVNNLSSLLVKKEELDEGQALLEEGLEIRRQHLPAGHPRLLSSLNNLSVLCEKRGQFERARELQIEVIEHLEGSVGRQHARTYTTRCNLAASLFYLQDYDAALQHSREVLLAPIRTLGPGHPARLRSWNTAVVALVSQGRLTLAKSFAKIAWLRGLDFGDEQFQTECRRHLQLILKELGESDAILSQWREDEEERELSRLWPATTLRMNETDPEVAAELVDHYLAILDLEDHDMDSALERVAIMHEQLALCLMSLQDPEFAEEHFYHAYESFLALYGAEDLRTLLALRSLAECLRQQERWEEAREYEQELRAITGQ